MPEQKCIVQHTPVCSSFLQFFILSDEGVI